jgi:gluconate 2-dehydrogenase gamma chain
MDEFSRRLFLARLLTGSGAALALSALPQFAAAHDHFKKTKPGDYKFTSFSAAEARELDAVCERIIPSEDGPGAREAGSVIFIDYVVTHFEPELLSTFRKGLADLAEQSAPKLFSELPTEQQIAILKKYDTTEEFKKLRDYAIFGFLSDPTYGGNRDHVGWQYIGFEDDGMFFPPFGYYDAQETSTRKEGE